MKNWFVTVLMVGICITANAARLSVGGAGYQSIQAALNAAADFDTIFVGSGSWTGDLAIVNPVHLIGRGSIATNARSVIYGQITLNGNSSGTTISGFHIQQNSTNNKCIRVFDNVSTISIENCRLINASSYNANIEIFSNCYSIIVRSSILQNANLGISMVGPGDIAVENSIFNSIAYCLHTTNGNICTFNIANCDFAYVTYVFSGALPGSSVSNSLFWFSGINNCDSILLRYNCAYQESWGQCSNLGNFRTDVFPVVNNPGGFYNPLIHDISPIQGSPVLDSGDPNVRDRDGSRIDIGCTGGLNPFNFSGIPEYPATTWLNVPVQVYQGQSLPVQAEGIIGD